MAARLRRGEPGTKNIQRIVGREAKKARKDLEVGGQPGDARVHEARKRIKRARAALRLIRKPLGGRRFRRENEALRDAGRPLSEVRDAKILVEAFDALLESGRGHRRPGLRRVRQMLIAHQSSVRRRVYSRKEPLKPVTDALRSARKRAKAWHVGGDGWAALGPGLRRVYRAGRRVFAEVCREASDERLHELRKQAKYLWHQLEMLEPIAPSPIKVLARRTHRLSDQLGRDHDLAVLKNQVSRSGARVPRTEVEAISRLIDRRRAQLRAKAMGLGARVYEERPRRFTKRLEARWHTWRSEAG
jgi:CHAD domain-containing protein